MQGRLVDAISDLPTLSSLKEVQQFLGLANFYRRLIKEYAKLVQPISDLVRTKTFVWNESQSAAFSKMKKALTSAPVLAHPSADKPFVVSTDASKFAIGATLEQDGRPVAYLSHRLTKAEARWDTGDQELLAFMIALREWSVYLRGCKFIFRTDHEPLRYLQSKSRLSGRQYRWIDTLQAHSYDVEQVPGKQHIVPDALSRRPYHQVSATLKSMLINNPQFPDRIKSAYGSDPWTNRLINAIRDGEKPKDRQVEIQLSNYIFADGFIYWVGSNEKRIYVFAAKLLSTTMTTATWEWTRFMLGTCFGQRCTMTSQLI